MGNARIASCGRTMYVGGARIVDSNAPNSVGLCEWKVTNGNHSFTFTLDMTRESSKLFIIELQQQIEGKSSREVEDKKKQIRNNLARSQRAGYKPEIKLENTSTPSRRGNNKVRLNVSTSPNEIRTSPSLTSTPFRNPQAVPSSMRSPYRSPFTRSSSKRQALSPLPVVPSGHDSSTIRPVTRRSSEDSTIQNKWLSPTQVRKIRANFTPPSLQKDMKTPSSHSSNQPLQFTRSPSHASKEPEKYRVRSLSQMLDSVPNIKQVSVDTPSNSQETVPATPGKARKDQFEQQRSPNLDRLQVEDEVLDSEAVSLMHGLLNMGNNCYMNAILQALASLSDFVRDLRQDNWLISAVRTQMTTPRQEDLSIETPSEDFLRNFVHEAQANHREMTHSEKEALESTRFTLYDALDDILHSISTGEESPISPERIKWVMGQRKFIFANHLQQDAHEFLVSILDELEKDSEEMVNDLCTRIRNEMNECGHLSHMSQALVSNSPSRVSAVSDTNDSVLLDKENVAPNVLANVSCSDAGGVDSDTKLQNRVRSGAAPTSLNEILPVQYFRGQMVQTLTCVSCQYSRRQMEHFYDLSLDLPPQPERKKHANCPSNETITTASQDFSMENADAQEAVVKCHCGEPVLAQQSDHDTQVLLTCAKAACSFRKKEKREALMEHDTTEADFVPSGDTAATIDVLLNDQQSSNAPGASKVDTQTPCTASPCESAVESTGDWIWQLEDVITDLFRPQRLDLKCEECKIGKEAEMMYRIVEFPRVLILHLKRFELDPWQGTLVKRCDQIDSPIWLTFNAEGVLSDDNLERDTDRIYRLQSIVHHLGQSLDQGHYIADICKPNAFSKHPESPRRVWCRMNDQFELEVSEDQVLSASRSRESSYMFFFVQQDKTKIAAS
nr:ubiquitinspecific protease putative [Albugo laibachii Nc14]|eukprot:CCA16301.1 ubiquitinspecific protease putative [Albugo laibachii Nc14]